MSVRTTLAAAISAAAVAVGLVAVGGVAQAEPLAPATADTASNLTLINGWTN